ncbi:thioredoxin family protein [soil metagenome]
MRSFATLLASLALLAMLPCMPNSARAQAQTAPDVDAVRIEAELVPMSAWAAPGSTAVVAVRQSLSPGWHTYWRNPGDSGGPTTLEWALPAGLRAGDIVWPLPTRQRLAGLLSYGYQGEVFLPVPIEVPATAKAGTSLPLKVEALFLVCSADLCAPEHRTLTLALPIRDGTAPLAPFGAKIQAVVETAPRPAGITSHISLEGQTLTLSAAGGPLVGGVSRASFFPYDPHLISHPAPQFGQRGSQGVTLSLAAVPGPAMVGLASGSLATVSGVLTTDRGAWEITATPGPPLAGTRGGGGVAESEDLVPKRPEPSGLSVVGKASLFAFLGGLILNLMPCVFPVLAMKAASLARSAHDAAEARRDGLAFTAGVLATFLALGGGLLVLRAAGLAVGWGFQLQSPPVVAGLALLMLAVALNLSGVFALGNRLRAVAGSRLSRLPGGTGAFFTGVLAVVVAAPCTAPFMAFALGAALVMPAPAALAIFLMLGVGLALPYLLVSLSPALLSRLPRPGPWMVWLQRGLSVPMYLAALWLAWVFGRQTGAQGQAMIAGAAIALGAALWLAGRAQRRIAAGSLDRGQAIAAAFAGLAALAFVASAVLAPRPVAASEGGESLPSQPWSPEAVAQARAQGRPVFVDFTADWCVSCKINERAALSSPTLARTLAETRTVFLKADWTRRDDAIARELSAHGRSGVPLYLIYVPGETQPRILPQLLTEGVVIDALKTTGRSSWSARPTARPAAVAR